MKKFIAFGMLFITATTFAIDYQQSLDHLKRCQEGFSDIEAISHILSLAKSDAHPEIVTHAMALYTLHAASVGETKICLSAYKEAVNRYPNAKAIIHLKSLNLFPDACSTCAGTGVVDQQQEKVCRSCNRTGKCPKCGGTGRMEDSGLKRSSSNAHDIFSSRPSSRVSFDTRCLTCGGSGRCGSCGGVPLKPVTIKVPCTVCSNKKEKVNADIAQEGLIRLSQSFRDVLQMALDCETYYQKALEQTDATKQLEALKLCSTKYRQAINYSLISEKISDATKKAHVLFLEQERLRKETDAEKARLAVQKAKEEKLLAQLAEQHEELLYSIRIIKTTSAALNSIKAFISENPQSPIIQKARILREELVARAEQEKADATRKKYIYIGIGIFLLLCFGTWLASCVQSK
jgi:hypothetical protein